MDHHIARRRFLLGTGAACAYLTLKPRIARAAVSADQAAQLKTTLTPFGAVRAGNADGTIPAWEGGYSTVPAGFVNGGKRSDPFAGEQPTLKITAANMSQYADKLTEGTKALLTKYADFYVDVYPTHRTAVAPQWVYDAIFDNATRATLTSTSGGSVPAGVYGGTPFPIPQSGEEVVWNHQMRWRAASFRQLYSGYILSADGAWTLLHVTDSKQQFPFLYENSNLAALEANNGRYLEIYTITTAPALEDGQSLVGQQYVDHTKDQTWVYISGQGRVREVPNPCCDVFTPFSSGQVYFDEIGVWNGQLNHFDWNLVGTQEFYVPYNSNISMQPPTDAEMLGTHTLNPQYVRFELRRVRVVDATLKAGFTHPAVKSRYYFDEDTGTAILAERYNAQGRLWRVLFELPMVYPDVPTVDALQWGVYDLIAGTAYVENLYNSQSIQGQVVDQISADVFTPDSLSANGDSE